MAVATTQSSMEPIVMPIVVTVSPLLMKPYLVIIKRIGEILRRVKSYQEALLLLPLLEIDIRTEVGIEVELFSRIEIVVMTTIAIVIEKVALALVLAPTLMEARS